MNRLPLFIAMGGCLGFGLFSYHVCNSTITTISVLRGLSQNLAVISYRKGCLEASTKRKQSLCTEKSEKYRQELQSISDQIDHLSGV